MRHAVIKDGAFSGVIVTDPKSWNGVSFGQKATSDTYRKAGLWPIERQDSGPSNAYERPNALTKTLDPERQVVVETIQYDLPPLEQVRDQKIAEIEAKHAKILDGGFDYDFGTKTATLPDGTTELAGVRTIQTRPGDRERWQATMQVAQQYIMAGVPIEPMRSFRTEDDAMVPMTAQDVADCLNAMQAKFGQALDALWTHKDAVRSLTTVDDAVAYDHTTGWP